jgi:hypothetical protein
MGRMNERFPADIEAEAHAPILAAAAAVQRAVWQDFNLRAAWPWIDPTLRRCMLQQWLTSQRKAFKRRGCDPVEVVDALAEDDPRHPLWCVYEAAQIQALNAQAPEGISGWVLTANTEAVAPDIEMVGLYEPPPEGEAADGPWVSMTMRYAQGAGWRLLSLNEEVPVPVPGWPPTL